jgi:nucleoside-diphosphate-sugar epimerase
VTFIYGDRQGEWVDEASPLPSRNARIIASAVDMEQLVRAAVADRSLPAIILRYGSFYCSDSAQTRALFELTRAGSYRMIGDGAIFQNNIHVDDAAQAVLKAVDHYQESLGQTFNVCDDEPVLSRDLLTFVAEALKAGKPARISLSEAEASMGPYLVELLQASVRCRNGLVKERLAWTPLYPTYREGYRAEIEKWLHTGSSSRVSPWLRR